MTLWVCKGGKRGERESRFKENSLVAIGFDRLNDLSIVQTRDELKAQYEKAWPDAPQGRKNNHVGQVYAFLKKVTVGDLVVVPMKTSGTIWIGEIKSEYKFRQDLGGDMKHTRDVQWLEKDLPRSSFDKAILYSFGSAMTFSRAERHQAEESVRNLVKKKKQPSKGIAQGITKTLEVEVPLDLEDLATNQLRDFISQRFKGHELAWLIAGILEAQGLRAIVSPPGPDGGVDITASSGFLGPAGPRICVQVKSQDSPIDVKVYRELRDRTNTIKATHGLLVSWGGFKGSIDQESKNDVFFIQRWESKDVIEQLLRNYATLPAEIKSQIPLKQIWILAQPEDEE
jgi:restriction system protein